MIEPKKKIGSLFECAALDQETITSHNDEDLAQHLWE